MKYVSLCIGLIGLVSVNACAMEQYSSVSRYGQLTICNVTEKEVRVSYPSHLTTERLHSNLPPQLADRLHVDMSRAENVIVTLHNKRYMVFPMLDKWQAVGVSETKDGRYAQIYLLDELGQRTECLATVRTSPKTKKPAVPMRRAQSALPVLEEDTEATETTWVKYDSPRGINPLKTTPHLGRPRVRTKSNSVT